MPIWKPNAPKVPWHCHRWHYLHCMNNMYCGPPNQPPALLAVVLQDPWMVQMALKMMNQNPHLLLPMQDPRIMQQAMQMMQQQQVMQLSRSMAALSVQDAPALCKLASNKSCQELQQAALQE